MRRVLLPMLALTLCLSACAAPAGNPPSPSPQSTATSAPAPTPALTPAPPWWEGVSSSDLPSNPSVPEEIQQDSGAVYQLAVLPEQEIALYGYGGSDGAAPYGVLIGWGSELAHFDQRYLSPENPALPEIWWDDFDGDGTGELAVKYLVQNGGNHTVFELHIYEQDGAGWIDHAITAEDYTAQLSAAVSAQFDPETRLLTATAGDTQTDFYLEDLDPAGDPPPLVFADQVFYRYRDGVFTGVYDTGVTMGSPAIVTLFFASTLGEVVYDGEGFTLKNIRLQSTTGV